MRRTATVAALAALLLSAAPAAAAPPRYGPLQPACVEVLGALGDGTVYGAGDCGGRITVLQRRPGGSWQPFMAAWRDRQVEAVAVDNTGVFVVVSCSSMAAECGAPAPQGKQFSIGKVPFRGGPTPLTQLGGSESGDTATVSARDGRWWAAWTDTLRDYDEPGSGSQTIRWRKTFGGPGSGTLSVPAPPEPSMRVFSSDPNLVLTQTGAAVAFVTYADRPNAEPALQLATAGSDGRFETSPYEPAAGAAATAPDLAFSGGRLFVAWARNGRPALGFERDGRHMRTDLPFRGAVWDVAVAASGGLATVATSEEFAYAGGRTTRVYARSFDTAARLQATTELTAAAGREDPHVRAALHDATAARGRATVAFTAGSRTGTASQS